MKKQKNRDIEQILLFTDCVLGNWNYVFKESQNGLMPEDAYLAITSKGIKKENIVTRSSLNLNKLLTCKMNRDLHKKQWTDCFKDGTFTAEELCKKGFLSWTPTFIKKYIQRKLYRIGFFSFNPDWFSPSFESVVFDCMKDIIKTSDRLEIMSDGKTHPEFENRNWFMDRLQIVYPTDIHPCSYCKECFWKLGTYVKL